jgi:ParB family chromosome partitioning protein
MTVVVEQIELIDLTKLEVHPSNPRKQMGDLDELAASIKSAGLIEPIVAVRHNGKYQVVAGSRRLAAARKAKLENLPVRVMDLDEAQAMAAALIENLQRKDLEPLEQAEAFRGWLALTGKTQKELSDVVGLAPSTIANALRLLEAPKPVQDALRTQQIGAEHARVLLTLKDPGLATKIKIKPGITVEQLREDVTALNADHLAKGSAAVDAAKKALADATTKHPGVTITWRAPRNWQEQQVVDLTKALGKPPTSISGEIRTSEPRGTWEATSQPTAAAHDKVCECRAVRMTARQNYNVPTALPVFEFARVCVDTEGWKKARPKQKRVSYSSSSSKPKTPAQVAKQERAARERATKELKRELAVRKPRNTAGAIVFKKLGKTTMPADLARALVATEVIAFGLGDQSTTHIAWERIAAMPAKKISELAVSLIAEHFQDEMLNSVGVQREDSGERRAAEYFGVKFPEPKKAKPKP